MRIETKNMTTGSPAKLIFSFSLPLMVGNIFQQLYTVVDTAVVGRALGVKALAGLGASDWLNWMIIGVIQGFAQGFSILMAQYFGAEDYKGLRKSVGNSLVLAGICAVAVLAISQAGLGSFLDILGTPDSIRGYSELYLRIIFWGIPVITAYNIFASILRALGDGKTPLNAMIIAAAINVVLDLIFVLVLHWGIAGAASATIIAQVFSALYCLNKMLKIPELKLSRDDWKLDARLDGRLFLLGLPMAFQNLIIAVGGLIVQKVVNAFGVFFIAGFTATNKLYGILEVAATSYGYAMTTYTGQNVGAGKLTRIRQGMKSGLLIALLTSAVITTAMLIFGKSILMLFITGDKETVTETLAIAFRYLKIMSLFLPILYFLHVTRSCIQGMGNTLLPMASGITEFIMRTGAALLLPLLVGRSGIFYAEILAWAGADIVLVCSYIYSIKKLDNKEKELNDGIY